MMDDAIESRRSFDQLFDYFNNRLKLINNVPAPIRGVLVVDMAEGVVMEDGKLPSESSQTAANIVDAGASESSLPTLLVVVSEILSDAHKDAVANRIATGGVLTCVGGGGSSEFAGRAVAQADFYSGWGTIPLPFSSLSFSSLPLLFPLLSPPLPYGDA